MQIFKFLQNKLKISRVLIMLLGIVIFSFFAFGFFKDTKSPSALAQSGVTESPDAIAIRIIPNPSHYSISRWYGDQKFKGSPQSLIVDGYEAIRDGRTVYVNAANVESDTLYTNIYLISYNQDAGGDTTSILDQIISHWKFNNNKTDTGHCSKTTTTVCLIDADCPSGEYCDSPKAKITRDTKRLAELADLKIAIENYKESKTYYPKLSAGTYLAGKTVSTWPSWQQTLAKDLGASLPTDPINKLGACKNPENKNYNSTTCWSEKDKLFAGAIGDGTLELPGGSNAFVYTVASNGSSYNICGVMESGFVKTLAAGACAGSAKSYSGATANNNPVITCGTLIGAPGKEFKGYVGASDSDGDALTWNINMAGAWTNWSPTPASRDTANSNQKEIYSSSAGNNGNYNFSVTVNDNRGGGPVSKNCTIKIMSVPVTPTCSTSGACDGYCPAYCTAIEDYDCKATGCKPGDGKCDPALECSTGGSGDCVGKSVCCNNGTCDSASGENSTNCIADCPVTPVVSSCQFNTTLPCLLQ